MKITKKEAISELRLMRKQALKMAAVLDDKYWDNKEKASQMTLYIREVSALSHAIEALEG